MQENIRNNASAVKTDIKSMTLEELTRLITGFGDKSFRAGQIYGWMHQKLVAGYDEMTNVPQSLREMLKKDYPLTVLKTVCVQTSQLDKTAKYLFMLPDGNIIESVLMHYRHGNSVCISSQVGCRMGCRFCASTIGGLVRDLTPSEMLDQIYRIQALTGERVDNVVVMGTGEPFDNFDNLVRFIMLLNDKNGLNISARSLTVSTCGIVPGIYRLADMQSQITLAVSLHAPDDELRRTIMPVADKYSVWEIMEACRYYTDRTGRRITFEYSLIKGVNDTDECAGRLVRLVKGLNCHINLIPVNPVKERGYRQTSRGDIQGFQKTLENQGVNVTVRREMGRDIDGACGQLRRRYIDNNI